MQRAEKSYFNGRVKSVKRAFSGFKAEVGKSCFFWCFLFAFLILDMEFKRV